MITQEFWSFFLQSFGSIQSRKPKLERCSYFRWVIHLMMMFSFVTSFFLRETIIMQYTHFAHIIMVYTVFTNVQAGFSISLICLPYSASIEKKGELFFFRFQIDSILMDRLTWCERKRRTIWGKKALARIRFSLGVFADFVQHFTKQRGKPSKYCFYFLFSLVHGYSKIRHGLSVCIHSLRYDTIRCAVLCCVYL